MSEHSLFNLSMQFIYVLNLDKQNGIQNKVECQEAAPLELRRLFAANHAVVVSSHAMVASSRSHSGFAFQLKT